MGSKCSMDVARQVVRGLMHDSLLMRLARRKGVVRSVLIERNMYVPRMVVHPPPSSHPRSRYVIIEEGNQATVTKATRSRNGGGPFSFAAAARA